MSKKSELHQYKDCISGLLLELHLISSKLLWCHNLNSRQNIHSLLVEFISIGKILVLKQVRDWLNCIEITQ